MGLEALLLIVSYACAAVHWKVGCSHWPAPAVTSFHWMPRWLTLFTTVGQAQPGFAGREAATIGHPVIPWPIDGALDSVG